MKDEIEKLYQIILDRKKSPAENSYTAYLFNEGLDKILKKCGEEMAETIIASKNPDNSETIGEICDVIYHVLVLMAELGISTDDVLAVLSERNAKMGNLKEKHQSDHLS